MKHKKVLLKNAFNIAHQPKHLIGVWWYQPSTGELEFSTKAQGHLDKRFSLRQQAGKDKNLLRGRLIKIKNKVYLVVYSNPYSPNRPPATILNDLWLKIEAVSRVNVDCILDEKGLSVAWEDYKKPQRSQQDQFRWYY